MGACWNSPLPPEADIIKRRLGTYGIQPSLPKPSNLTAGAGFSKEESQLRDLLAAVRTGLLFSPTQFSVMPGVATTGRVSFSLGNTELHKLIEEDEDSDSDELPEAIVMNEDESEGEEETECSKERYPLQITLKGKTWFNDLTMKLVIRPVLGPFAGRKIVFLWSGASLRVAGCEGLEAQCLPVEFENETQFCSCCLLLLYQSIIATVDEGEGDGGEDSESGGTVASLKDQAYRTTICNLDLVSDLYSIPAKLYYNLFGSRSPVIVVVKLWPGDVASRFNANATMRVKSHILFAEFTYLLQKHFGIPSNYVLKLYHNFKPVTATELLTEKHRQMDCFVICPAEPSELGGSYTSLDEGPFDSSLSLVTSLVGQSMMNVDADLDMTMREFDTLLRSQFSLGQNSFLVIVSEDDFSPQYTSDDNWRCTYPFNVPDTSISAGLRRSFRKLAVRRAGASRLTQSQRFNRSDTETSNSLAPHMCSVVRLLSSKQRQFPSNNDRYSLDLKELYTSMSLYQLSLSQCSLHTYSVVKVFEVTGPPIPVTMRQLSDYKQQDKSRPETCLANIMDINPSWSLNTFLQYVDTIISPGAGYRRTRLSLSHHRLDDTSEESEWALTLGQLLNAWTPAWWGVGGRAQLTPRDIDPAQFLLIEKY